MICTQVTQISHSTVGSSFSVSFSASPNELDMLYAMRDFFKKWNMSGISFTRAEQTEPQNDVSCFTCIHDNTGHIECQSCDDNYSSYEPKTEQTERSSE